MVTRIYLLMCLLAAMLPLIPLSQSGEPHATADFPGWPQQFEGEALQRLPLSAKETVFYASFPGKVARFTDGRREIIMRWVKTESRKFHSAADCFKGLGYTVKPEDLYVDQTGQRWGQFQAQAKDHSLLVRERISDAQGRQWTDVSAWYWDALLAQSHGPWWSVTVATHIDS
ncbi:MAG: hypothetical protein OEZ68_12920 [Gammaproteobacteria bacterium]|nr:hypothetical protein [Gammaproteobacteria bacterium]MDH5801700.1 hypothetical protein [Gammaproteobacteria bacterium]